MLKLKTTYLLTMLVMLLAFSGRAQVNGSDTIPLPELGPNDTIPVPAMIVENQYIPGGYLPWYYVTAKMSPQAVKRRAEWTRLRNAVYVTYPYAKRAGIIMNDINAKLSTMPEGRERKKFIKSREKELKKEFADPLSNLSVYQGKVLMKLINRQTGNNCYEIVKEYKGGFTARFWQTVAFVFGSNLKQPYEASTSDREIELIVREVERMYNL